MILLPYDVIYGQPLSHSEVYFETNHNSDSFTRLSLRLGRETSQTWSNWKENFDKSIIDICTYTTNKRWQKIKRSKKKKLFTQSSISLPPTQGRLREKEQPKVSLKNVVRLITGQETGRQLPGANPIKIHYCKSVETFHIVSEFKTAFYFSWSLVQALAQHYSCFDRWHSKWHCI